MARGATVKQEQDDALAGAEQKTNKRRCVQSACGPCRKRKSKCDGGTPVCATCTAVYKTPCFYDAESENRRSKATAAKRDNSVVSTHSQSSLNDNAEFLVSSIRTLPENEVYELIQQIRKDARLDIAALADTWRKTVTVPPAHMSTEPQSLEGDLSMLLGKPAMTQSGESRYFGHTSALSLIQEDENYTPSHNQSTSAEHKNPTWTSVTQDVAFVERLLDLYFRWSHPFYVIFSRESFYKDFRSGREKYCSSLLVNAILSYACHFTDEAAARIDPDNARTAGDHFFEEARRLLYEDETPSLTTTQALCVMAMREPSAGRDSSGFMYIGRCMRMAIELGLHLNNSAAPAMRLTPSEVEVRKVTFWGCFTVDTVWSICVGRISQLPRAAITLEKPILEETSAYPGAAPNPSGMVTSRVFLQEFSTLSEVLNDNNYMFFAPKERFTSRRLLECYNRYQEWYKHLPQSLRLDGVREPQPHIIVLHMLYHTAIVHLFRPMLKVDLIHSHVRPRDACLDAANQVAELLRLYRRHYSLRACQLVLTHILLSVNIVHLLYSNDSKESYRNLVEGLVATDDISTCHYFGKRGFKIVQALSKMWNLPFPEELESRDLASTGESGQGVVSPQAQSSFIESYASGIASRMGAGAGFSPLVHAAVQQPSRRESLSMFAHPDPKTTQTPSQHPVPPASQTTPIVPSQRHHHHRAPPPQHQQQQQQQRMVSTYPATSSPSTQQAHPTTQATPTSTMSGESLFWTPVPGMGVPILPRNYQVSPMDLDNMLGNANEWDRFSRDGFKISDQWQQDPMATYGSGGQGHHHTEGYNHHHHHHHHPGVAAENSGYAHDQEGVPFSGQDIGNQGGVQQQQQQGGGSAGGTHHSHHEHHGIPHHQGFDTGWWGGQGS
ncbi:hypothetical protein DM02DRAFT_618998 [Periconia macrospinosa]|uniref:Zn(2)-C6 fungal-type domain-containing protein n=1 Tax=Periconia macrospinosa TaxID=97972 RepID=A0A2V1D761_9PLEO|nr:hypothetical protein DM02DRAFT_618998 [Periconia macrospinosa]